MSQSTCYLVLGVPRSGTNAVAGVLHSLGISMGDEFSIADDWNPKGYRQDRELDDLLNEIVGGRFWPASEITRFSQSERAAEVTQYAARKSAQQQTWGVKNSLLPYVLGPFLAGCQNVRLIVTQRPFAASVQSWQERDGVSLARSEQIIQWSQEVQAEAISRAGLTPWLTIEFDQLIDSTAAVIDQVISSLGVSNDRRQSAIEWIEPGLRRHV